MANLQLPEGYTVRKCGNTLKVVPMRRKKVAIVKKEEKMPKQIKISIHPFGSAREQLWIGEIVEGEFAKERILAKVPASEITAKKTYDGKFGKPSTSEDWDITIPDNFPHAIAKSQWSDPTFVNRHIEYEVLYTPVA